MRPFARVMIAALVLCHAGAAAAQTTDGPAPGSWAVEGGVGSGASLLKFRSSSSAWILNGYAYVIRQTIQDFDPLTGGLIDVDQTIGSSQLRLGLRSYGPSRDKLRSFRTLSAIVGFIESGGSSGWQFGAAGDIGAAYFFTPHVSMGGSAELNAIYTPGRDDDSFFRRSLNANFTGVRLLGTVYF
jgi:hypothetical protein